MSFFGIDLTELLLRIPAMLLAIGIHEACHGFAAYALGDPTAKNNGRLTLNPLAHIDLIGALCLIFFRFGWAKPVPINPNYFKRPKLGMALTALAGPASNFVLGFFSTALMVVCWLLPGSLAVVMGMFFQILSLMSIGLGLFNLIPVPPLDGSKLLWPLLPDRVVHTLARYEQYVILLLLVGMYFGLLTRPLNVALNAVYRFFFQIIRLFL